MAARSLSLSRSFPVRLPIREEPKSPGSSLTPSRWKSISKRNCSPEAGFPEGRTKEFRE